MAYAIALAVTFTVAGLTARAVRRRRLISRNVEPSLGCLDHYWKTRR